MITIILIHFQLATTIEPLILKIQTIKKTQSFHGIWSNFINKQNYLKTAGNLEIYFDKKALKHVDLQEPQASSQGHLSNSDVTNQEVDLSSKVS